MNKQALGNGTLLERHERQEVNLKTECLNIRKLERWERARQHEDLCLMPRTNFVLKAKHVSALL